MLSEAQRIEVIGAARRGAHEHYLCALLAPPGARDDLLVLAAFEGELRHIVETVGEPMLAEIRLQWWRDCVAAMVDGRQTGHPVGDALASLVVAGHVSAASLQKSIDARSVDTGHEPIATEPDLDDYLDQADGEALARAVAAVSAALDLPLPEQALVRSAGRSIGLTRILLDLPERPSLRQALGQALLLPGLPGQEMSDPNALKASDEAAFHNDQLAHQCCKYADQAGIYLGTVRPGWSALSRGHRAALGPVALVGPYLRALQRLGCLEPHPGGVIAPVSRVARLWWAVRFARL